MKELIKTYTLNKKFCIINYPEVCNKKLLPTFMRPYKQLSLYINHRKQKDYMDDIEKENLIKLIRSKL